MWVWLTTLILLVNATYLIQFYFYRGSFLIDVSKLAEYFVLLRSGAVDIYACRFRISNLVFYSSSSASFHL